VQRRIPVHLPQAVANPRPLKAKATAGKAKQKQQNVSLRYKISAMARKNSDRL